MVLVVGLGNPGKKFDGTRHNIGFRVADELAKKNNFSDFKKTKKINSLTVGGFLNKKEVIVIKPQTFMNNSGKAIKLLTKPYILNPNGLIVVHDDIDLPVGKIRISKNRGAAGHKGIESVIRELKTKNFIRFRIGIQSIHKTVKPSNYKAVESFVLQKFTKDEEKIIKEVIIKTIEAIKDVLKEGAEKTMNKYN